MYNILGFLLVIIALGIQSWMSIVQTNPESNANTGLFTVSLALLIPGSVLLAALNINRLFATYHRMNYAIALIGLVGLSMLLVFRGYLESLLLFPNIMIVYFLIFDLFWIFLLGLLLRRFQTTANIAITTN